MMAPMMSVMIFEMIVVWLGFAGMVQADGVAVGVAGLAAGITTLWALIAVAGLRRPWGQLCGWLTQIAALAMGFLSPWMWVMGGIFALLWVMAFIMGRRIDKLREG